MDDEMAKAIGKLIVDFAVRLMLYEREECAKLAEAGGNDGAFNGSDVAEAIRARKP